MKSKYTGIDWKPMQRRYHSRLYLKNENISQLQDMQIEIPKELLKKMGDFKMIFNPIIMIDGKIQEFSVGWNGETNSIANAKEK